ncbi:hypothetical protein VDGE_30457 [Verticillium dahliae]|uniref:Cytochrome b5 heme-binding domain-containing protein n=1 Tax=Verticillium dahliae TaxID=27337 RepID=A0A444RXS8_VERDA|nr:hypothetical protein VDGE_30457 [Verticillium dahliae]
MAGDSTMDKVLRLSEIRHHDVAGDCWIAIHGTVYDITNLLDSHPGGKAILLRFCNHDTKQKNSCVLAVRHSINSNEKYPQHLGNGKFWQTKHSRL